MEKSEIKTEEELERDSEINRLKDEIEEAEDDLAINKGIMDEIEIVAAKDTIKRAKKELKVLGVKYES